MLINTQCIYPGQPVRRAGAALGFCLDRPPKRVPGDAQLIGHGREGSIEAGERIGGPVNSPGGQFRFHWRQRVRFSEGPGRAVSIGAAPYSFDPIQPDRATVSGCVMQAHHAPAVTDRYDPTDRAVGVDLLGFTTDDLLAGSILQGNNVDGE